MSKTCWKSMSIRNMFLIFRITHWCSKSSDDFYWCHICDLITLSTWWKCPSHRYNSASIHVCTVYKKRSAPSPWHFSFAQLPIDEKALAASFVGLYTHRSVRVRDLERIFFYRRFDTITNAWDAVVMSRKNGAVYFSHRMASCEWQWLGCGQYWKKK